MGNANRVWAMFTEYGQCQPNMGNANPIWVKQSQQCPTSMGNANLVLAMPTIYRQCQPSLCNVNQVWAMPTKDGQCQPKMGKETRCKSLYIKFADYQLNLSH